MGTSVTILADPDAVAGHLAATIAADVDRGIASIGLSGGSTPKTALGLLKGRSGDWAGTTFWVVDERWVPHDHADCNAAMIQGAFATATGARLVHPDYGGRTPHESAAEYAAVLDGLWGGHGPNVVHLGLGTDGHTASLFPDTEALDVRGAGYVANWVPRLESWRLTATVNTLWSADRLVFTVTGAPKADIVAAIIDREEPFPATLVAAGARSVEWLIDEAAAARLRDGRPDRSSS